MEGFEIRLVAGPEIVDIRGLKGPEAVHNQSKLVWHVATYQFGWVWDLFRAF
jgi:hypothetical protein